MENQWEKVEVVAFDEVQLVEIPAGATPDTVAKDGMDAYEAAKQIRQITKMWKAPGNTEVDARLNHLEALLVSRTTKVQRLEALAALKLTVRQQQEKTRVSFEKVRVLAQHLPTVKALPQGGDENIVRAFIAILKTHGKIKN